MGQFDVSSVGGDKLGFPFSNKARLVPKQFPYVGLANDDMPRKIMREISGMKNFSIWHGMEAGFSFDKPGRFELKLRQYSEDTLIAELSPGDGYTYPRTRYLPAGNGPYHLVVHIPTCGDRPDEEPP